MGDKTIKSSSRDVCPNLRNCGDGELEVIRRYLYGLIDGALDTGDTATVDKTEFTLFQEEPFQTHPKHKLIGKKITINLEWGNICGIVEKINR
ncbi:MAG: hypothetical protein UC390_02830 [Peptococcaceae bacterium]|nr:hypothetical protein [Peptococcaceae bacterium]